MSASKTEASKKVQDTGSTVAGPSRSRPGAGSRPGTGSSTLATLDIEHVPVKNDPRQWSSIRKSICLGLVSFAATIAGIAATIQNPAIQSMKDDLHATNGQFSLSIAVFILVQGLVPLVWSTISEFKGRKVVYLSSLAFFTIGSIVSALSPNIELVIGFRAVQAAGSSAVITIGAATLADIYEPEERGTKMGIYFIAPLLGPALGPILGGILTTGLSWRAIFWFCAILSGLIFLSFVIFYNDTFRKERSLLYQNALNQRLREDRFRSASKTATNRRRAAPTNETVDVEKTGNNRPQENVPEDMSNVQLTWKDVNPIRPICHVMRRWNNLAILLASGLFFAFAYLIAYTTARTLDSEYHYNALFIGLALLAFGIGSVAGSVLGGHWSDRELARLAAENDGESYAELRLRSTLLGMAFFAPSVLGFGWVCQRHVHIAVVCLMLFACGFFSIWIYASTLAYLVDANPGRSSTAFACNSASRGIFAFIATEVAVPLQDGLGDGWTYTIWAGLMVFASLLILLVCWKGQAWRRSAEQWEEKRLAQ